MIRSIKNILEVQFKKYYNFKKRGFFGIRTHNRNFQYVMNLRHRLNIEKTKTLD